ncbi:hypothetical protein ACFL6I_08900 [candidate division KSB1 bacterium]
MEPRMCSHIKGLEVIAQVVDRSSKKKTNLYNCPVCKSTYVKEKMNRYRKITPRYFTEIM